MSSLHVRIEQTEDFGRVFPATSLVSTMLGMPPTEVDVLKELSRRDAAIFAMGMTYAMALTIKLGGENAFALLEHDRQTFEAG